MTVYWLSCERNSYLFIGCIVARLEQLNRTLGVNSCSKDERLVILGEYCGASAMILVIIDEIDYGVPEIHWLHNRFAL